MVDADATVPRLIELSRETSQFVGGTLEQGAGKPFEVVDPSYGTGIATVAGASLMQVGAMIAAAKSAHPAWAGLAREERVAMLRRFIDRLAVYKDELRDVLMKEAGCPGARGNPAAEGIMEFQSGVPTGHAYETLGLYLSMPEEVDNPIPVNRRINPMGKAFYSVTRYVPVGVVAAIAAYNYPYLTAIWKVIPALVTGNTVILRPSPLTPISSLVFAQAALEAELPTGVLSVMIEGGIDGAHLLTTHPDVGMVTFTGSSTVGREVMKQAADTMKRVQLELGGKSAQIFLPGFADQAIGAAAGVCLAHAGQGCVLGTRIMVPEVDKARVLEKMKTVLENVKIGPADGQDTVLGPLISEAQVRRCEHFVDLAVKAGAKVVTGGRRPDNLKGYFFEPTVLDSPGNDSPDAQEEIFGPVVSVIGYRDVDHAIEMANDSPYGLSGYVFGDNAKAVDVALRLKTGAVNVNGSMMTAYSSGGGHRLSGIGRERGPDGLRQYQDLTTMTVTGA